MTFLYEGYQFLRNKEVWTCIRWVEPMLGLREPCWDCESETGLQSRLPLSMLATYPQVVSTPSWTGRDVTAGHPGEPGTRGRYTKGCRCDQCKAANAAYMKRKRKQDRND